MKPGQVKSLTMERVVPSLEVFCAQLGPDADDVLWRCSAPDPFSVKLGEKRETNS